MLFQTKLVYATKSKLCCHILLASVTHILKVSCYLHTTSVPISSGVHLNIFLCKNRQTSMAAFVSVESGDRDSDEQDESKWICRCSCLSLDFFYKDVLDSSGFMTSGVKFPTIPHDWWAIIKYFTLDGTEISLLCRSETGRQCVKELFHLTSYLAPLQKLSTSPRNENKPARHPCQSPIRTRLGGGGSPTCSRAKVPFEGGHITSNFQCPAFAPKPQVNVMMCRGGGEFPPPKRTAVQLLLQSVKFCGVTWTKNHGTHLKILRCGYWELI